MTIPTPAQLVELLFQVKTELDAAQDELVSASRDLPEKERIYRKGRAQAYLQVSGTADAKKAQVDALTADLRFDRDIADGLRNAALENVRSKRTQLSALQTIANSVKEEAALARTSPEGGF